MQNLRIDWRALELYLWTLFDNCLQHAYSEFCKLRFFDYYPSDWDLSWLGNKLTLIEPVLEDEGIHVFEWRGGEHRPFNALVTETDEVKKNKLLD